MIAAVIAALAVGGYVYGSRYLQQRFFRTVIETTEITLVSPAQSSTQLTATGYVVPQRVSKVGARIPGRLAELFVREGDQVKVGQLLARLEDADKRSAVASAKADVAAALAKVQTARADLIEAQQKAKRERKLAGRGVGPVANAEDAEARVASLKAAVKAALANVHAARARVALLRVNVDYTQITAPMNGTVINKPTEPGESIDVATPILELADFNSIMVEADVPEARLHMVKAGGPCEILLDAHPGKRLRGEVASISPRVDRAKATATVKIRFIEREQRVLPQMAARVNFLDKPLRRDQARVKAKLVVPADAVAERGGAKVIFVVDEGRVRMRTVVLGESFAHGFVLRDGPPAGSSIVKRPPKNLKDGQRIKKKGDT